MRKPNFLEKTQNVFWLRDFLKFCYLLRKYQLHVAFLKESQSFLTKHSYFLRHTSCTYFSQESIMYLSILTNLSSYLADVYNGRSATCWRGSKTKSPRVAILSQRGQSGKNRNSKWLFKILIYHCEWIFTKCLMIPVGWNCSCTENEN